MKFKTILILLMLICPITALASTITVGPIGCNYTHIWEALDVANAGDVIEVQNGTYYEKLIIDKPIILRGNNTIIDGRSLRSPMELVSDGITIEGFIILNSGHEHDDAGIKVDSDNNIIKNNVIVFNNNGIFLNQAKGNNITGNIVSENFYEGIYLSGSCNNSLINNTINKQKGEYLVVKHLNGIYLYQSNNNTIYSNALYENEGCGVKVEDSYNNKIIENIANNNNYGIYVSGYCSSTEFCSQNIIAGNSLINNEEFNAYDSRETYGKVGVGLDRWYIVSDNVTAGNEYGDFNSPSEGCRDSDEDCICDFAYEIPGGNAIDKFPITTYTKSYLAEGTILECWQDLIGNKVIWSVNITVPSNITALGLRLTWNNPDNDLALLLFNDTGSPVATSHDGDIEENVKANNPAHGIWHVIVYGYHVQEGEAQEFDLEARVVE